MHSRWRDPKIVNPPCNSEAPPSTCAGSYRSDGFITCNKPYVKAASLKHVLKKCVPLLRKSSFDSCLHAFRTSSVSWTSQLRLSQRKQRIQADTRVAGNGVLISMALQTLHPGGDRPT